MVKKLKDLLINLSISLVSVVIVLLLIELVFGWVAPQNLNGTWRTLSEGGYMINKASWKAKHQTGDRVIRYTFNEQHLRGKSVDQDKYNILVLGDSFTFGWLLEEEDTYIGQLQYYSNQSFPETTQWLNGGAGGWGLADCRDFLRDYGTDIQPEMVVVYFNADDIGRSVKRTLFSNTSRMMRLKTSIEYSRLYNWLLENSHLFQWVRLRLIGIALQQNAPAKKPETNSAPEMVVPETRTGVSIEESLDTASELFMDIHSWCEERNIPMVVMTTGWHFDPPADRRDPEIEFIKMAPAYFDSLDVPFVDISPDIAPVIESDRERYIIGGDHHPNEEAAGLIGKRSWDFMQPILQEELGN